MNIIIVNDDKKTRMLIIKKIRELGYESVEFFEAASAKECLELLNQTEFDLIVSEWFISVMNGYRLLMKIRKLGINTPFGFIASRANPELWERVKKMGVPFFVSEPFEWKEVEKALKDISKT